MPKSAPWWDESSDYSPEVDGVLVTRISGGWVLVARISATVGVDVGDGVRVGVGNAVAVWVGEDMAI